MTRAHALATSLAAALAFLTPVEHGLASPQRIESLSRCMAYYAVAGGMDGVKEVDAGTAAVVKDLANDLYAQGEKSGAKLADVQNAVVSALLEANTTAGTDGMEALRSAHAVSCDKLVAEVRGLPF